MFRNWFNSYSPLPYQMPIRFLCWPLVVPSGASLFITKASPSEWMLGGLADATFAKLEHAVLLDEQCRHCVEGLSVCIHRRLCIYIYILEGSLKGMCMYSHTYKNPDHEMYHNEDDNILHCTVSWHVGIEKAPLQIWIARHMQIYVNTNTCLQSVHQWFWYMWVVGGGWWYVI